MRTANRDGSAKRWLEQWARLLRGPLEQLLDVLVSSSRQARDLRQSTPFAGVLTDAERRRILATTVGARR